MLNILVIILLLLAGLQFFFAFFMPWKKLADTFESSGAKIKNKNKFIITQKILHFLVGACVLLITYVSYKNDFQLNKVTITLIISLMILAILPTLNKKINIKF